MAFSFKCKWYAHLYRLYLRISRICRAPLIKNTYQTMEVYFNTYIPEYPYLKIGGCIRRWRNKYVLLPIIYHLPQKPTELTLFGYGAISLGWRGDSYQVSHIFRSLIMSLNNFTKQSRKFEMVNKISRDIAIHREILLVLGSLSGGALYRKIPRSLGMARFGKAAETLVKNQPYRQNLINLNFAASTHHMSLH